MARILVIGYGNPLRGDDSFGWRAAELLQARVADPGIEVLCLHQLTPELMEDLSRTELAVFIDAAAAGEPGSLAVRPIEAPPAGRASFTHHATPEALLAGAKRLYGSAPKGIMVSVSGADFSCSTELSPLVGVRMEEVIRRVLQVIGETEA